MAILGNESYTFISYLRQNFNRKNCILPEYQVYCKYLSASFADQRL